MPRSFSSLPVNSDPTSTFKFWGPACRVLLRIFFGNPGTGSVGSQCLLILAWRATAAQAPSGLRQDRCQVGPGPDLREKGALPSSFGGGWCSLEMGNQRPFSPFLCLLHLTITQASFFSAKPVCKTGHTL